MRSFRTSRLGSEEMGAGGFMVWLVALVVVDWV